MIIALDLETTGLDSNNDKIIEVALVKFDPNTNKIVDEYSSLVNPMVAIPELISNITSINDEDVEKSPIWSELKEKVSEFIGDFPILGHNVYFDKEFLLANGIDIEYNVTLDTFSLANFLNIGSKSLSLESLSDFLGIKLEGAHRALNDTIATMKLYHELIKSIKKLTKKKKAFLKYFIGNTDDSGLNYIAKNYLDNINLANFDPIENFLDIFSLNKGYKQIVIDNEIDNKVDNNLLSNIDGLEIRDNQKQMIDIVSKAFKTNSNVAIEAPTGVGKTFAYLVPAIIYSIKTGDQIYISTTTKALQDQIYYKDLEFLSKTLSIDFTYSKLKGKKNYIGINSFISFINEDGIYSKEKVSFVLKIIFWLFMSKSGELDELDYFGKEFSYLNDINADDPITFRSENKYEDYEFCVRARRQARQTNIVIINNNILFQDIIGDNSILGNLKNLIIDEAHNLEDVITSSYKKGFTLTDFEKNMSIIESIIGRKPFLELNINKEKIIFDLSILFDLLYSYINSTIPSDSRYKQKLIKPDFFGNFLTNNEVVKNVTISLIGLIDEFQKLPDEIYLKIGRELKFIEDIIDIVKICLGEDSLEKYIPIASYNERFGLRLEYTILIPGDYLSKYLYNELDTCILTSATLKTDNGFDYIENMLCLKGFSFYTLDTDFDYSKQSLLYIPNNIGNIKNNFEEVVSFLRNIFLIVRGNTLVLFTSFALIKDLYSNLNKDMKKEGINIYAQNIMGGKHKLINFFKNNSSNSILVGTDTFWEGIDISGDDLKYLIIHKIPFMVPTDPIFQARSRLFKNSFMEYSIPKSILKLKQGFGRLIRNKEDKGIVIFLDDRIYSTKWGESFYKAFPSDIVIKKGTKESFLDILEKRLLTKKR